MNLTTAPHAKKRVATTESLQGSVITPAKRRSERRLRRLNENEEDIEASEEEGQPDYEQDEDEEDEDDEEAVEEGETGDEDSAELDDDLEVESSPWMPTREPPKQSPQYRESRLQYLFKEQHILRGLQDARNPKDDIVKANDIADLVLRSYELSTSEDPVHNTNRIDKSLLEYIVTEALPSYIEILLLRIEYDDDSVASTINDFFQKMLLITIKLLQNWVQSVKRFQYQGRLRAPIPDKLRAAVSKILNEKAAPFYKRFNGCMDQERMMMFDNDDEGLLDGAEQDFQYSRCHLKNVELFVDKGGIDVVSQALHALEDIQTNSYDSVEEDGTDLEPHIGLESVNDLLEIIRQVGPIVEGSGVIAVPSSWSRNMRIIACAVRNIILTVSDDAFKTYDKKAIHDAVAIVTSNLCASVNSNSRDCTSGSSATHAKDLEGNSTQSRVDALLSADQEPEENMCSSRQFVEYAEFRLPIAERLLKSQRLDMRLNGLNDIKIVLGEANEQACLRRSTLEQAPIEMDRWQTGMEGWEDTIRYLIKWVRDKKILQYIFGPNIHLEIVQRSQHIFLFLLHAKALTDQDLEIVWGPIVANQHRSVVHGVFHVLTEIAQHFTLQQIEYMFIKLSTVPLSQLDPKMCALIRQLVSTMINRARIPAKASFTFAVDCDKLSFEAYLLLWKILRDSTALPMTANIVPTNGTEPASPTGVTAGFPVVDMDLLGSVYEIMNYSLQHGPGTDDRIRLLKMCLEDLREHHPGAMWGLKVIMKLMSSLSSTPTNESATPNIVTRLQTEFKLLDLFLDDLEHWTRTAKRALVERRCSATVILNEESGMDHTSWVSPPSPTSPCLSGKLTPLSSNLFSREQLSSRLDFFLWSVNHQAFTYSVDQMDVVWNCFIANPVGTEERDEAFKYLEQIESHDVFTMHYFRNRLPELDVRYFSPTALQYVLRCFISVNTEGARIAKMQDLLLVKDDLLEVDHIWNIALHCLDEEVGKDAVRFLAILHLDTETNRTEPAAFAKKQWHNLIDKCFAHLASAAFVLASKDTLKVPLAPGVETNLVHTLPENVTKNLAQDLFSSNRSFTHALKLQRCLQLLKIFLDMFEAKHVLPDWAMQRHGYLNENHTIVLKIQVHWSGKTIELSVNACETVLIFRRRVAKSLGFPRPDFVRLVNKGKELSAEMNGKTLKDLRICDREVVIVVKRQLANGSASAEADTTDGVSEHDDADYPNSLLSQPKYFDRFLDMLLLEEVYASQIWVFVMRLPTNAQMLSTLRSLNARMEWDTLLDGRSPFKLLYQLQIVHFLLKRTDESFQSTDWRRDFLAAGGLRHLLSILMSGTLDSTRRGGDFSAHAKEASADNGAESHKDTKAACLALLLHVVNLLTADDLNNQAQTFSGAGQHSLMMRLVAIVRACTAKRLDFTAEDLMTVENAATLLFSMLICDISLMNDFLDFNGLKEWILSALVKCESEEIRKIMSKMILKFCHDSLRGSSDVQRSTTDFILRKLLSYLPDVEDHTSTSTEYFILLGQLLCESAVFVSQIDSLNLFNELVHRIEQHPIHEHANTTCEDSVIIGLIKLLTILVTKDTDLKMTPGIQNGTVMKLIFNDCLFDVPAMNHQSGACAPPKCKSRAARSAAFSFLLKIIHDDVENFLQLTDLLLKQLNRGDKVGGYWNYSPLTSQKAICGYVGLQNLGATCYINSIMQQFYMNPSFRNGIFSADVPEGHKKDNLLYQLQVMFGYLKQSEKKAYEAYPFCEAYKDYDGQSMNVAVQMDVDEFFNMLFDRLETLLSGTPEEILFKKHFGGKLVQQVKSKDCDHVSEKEETFFVIQCEVKNKKNVAESLQLSVEGEVLDGDNKYFCAKCGKHVDAIKRSCIKQLPDNLILHLKRFEFDMETMKRIKINDHFEFPLRINMEPYTLDYLSRKDGSNGDEMSPFASVQDEYELVGVLVHTGTADSGHYYSFIKERDSQHGGNVCHTTNGNQWYQFNDSSVDLFDPSDISRQCYGGSELVTQWDPAQQKHVSHHFQKPYSAYMLFYEKCSETHPDDDADYAGSGNIPDDILTKIWRENTSFLTDKHIFDTEYFSFIWKVLNCNSWQSVIPSNDLPVDLLLRRLQVGTYFFLDTLAHSKDASELKTWIEFLTNLYKSHIDGCRWFIELLEETEPSGDINAGDPFTRLERFLFACPVQEIREAFVELTLSVLQALRQNAPSSYGLKGFDDYPAVDDTSSMIIDDNGIYRYCEDDSFIGNFIKILRDMLREAPFWWRHFEEYFLMLSDLADFGIEERIFMIRHSFVWRLVDFYLMDESPFTKKQKRPRMGDKFTAPPFRSLLTTVRSLVLTCDVHASWERRVDDDDSGDIGLGFDKPISLQRRDMRLLINANGENPCIFFWKQIREKQDVDCTKDIVQHLSQNADLRDKILHFLMNVLESDEVEHLKTVFDILAVVYQSIDNRPPQKAKSILGILKYVVKLLLSKQSPQFFMEGFNFLTVACNFIEASRIRQLLTDSFQNIIVELLVTNQFECIRRAAEQLIKVLYFGNHVANNSIRDGMEDMGLNMYSKLLDMLPMAEESMKNNNRRIPAEHRGWKIANYMRTLRLFTPKNQENHNFRAHFNDFFQCFQVVELMQLPCDQNKLEMLDFLHDMVTNYPSNLELITNNPNVYESFHSVLINLSDTEENILYNRRFLPHYYGIILLCCRHSEAYHAAWMRARNFFWALGTMLWGRFYNQHKPVELIELFECSISTSRDFRLKCWEEAFPSIMENGEAFLSFWHRMANKNSEADIIEFAKVGGLSLLSEKIVNELRDQRMPPTNEEFPLLRSYLEVLEKYLSALRSCLDNRDTMILSPLSIWTNQQELYDELAGLDIPGVPEDVLQFASRVVESMKQLFHSNTFSIID